MNFLNTGLIFTPEVFTLPKKGMGTKRAHGAMNIDITYQH